jgi:hypothetical protein
LLIWLRRDPAQVRHDTPDALGPSIPPGAQDRPESSTGGHTRKLGVFFTNRRFALGACQCSGTPTTCNFLSIKSI